MSWNEAIQQLHGEAMVQGALSKADGRTLGDARAEPIRTLRDYLAAEAPIGFNVVCRAWGSDDPNLLEDKTRAAFFAVWALLRYEYADAMLAERAKP